MKRALIILIGLAFAIAAGMFVERAISQFFPLAADEAGSALEDEDFDTPDLRAGSSSSASSSNQAMQGKMIRWQDIESSLRPQSSSESTVDADIDLRLGTSSSSGAY